MERISEKAPALVSIILLIASFSSCQHSGSSDAKTKADTGGYVYIEGQSFKDPQGRDIVLHGINVVNKDPSTGYAGHISPREMAMFRTWGFNVIRLGIIWDGLEPEPGRYSETYLQKIDDMIRWAGEHSLYVFLDMHQDLYSVRYSDGAPEWATITDDLPHETGAIWSDAYLISPAVQKAFDNFWQNTHAPDGTGIQDHYINLWQHIAKRYASSTTVIGYDIMNEPFMGSAANEVMPLLLQAYARMLADRTGQAPPQADELMYMWSTERPKVLETLAEKETYRNMIDAIYALNAQFESGPLTAFFQKARDAIRTVDQNHIIFTEHSYFTNMGVRGALGEIVDENGQKDNLVAYAAHGYDLVVDTDALAHGSNDRVELIFDRIAETGNRLGVPVLIGEWGALHGKSPELVPVASFLMEQFDMHGFSDAFWAYYPTLQEAPFLDALKKPYPVHTAGSLLSYQYDYDTGMFACVWMENRSVSAPTVIYIPDVESLSNRHIFIKPEAESIEIENIGSSNAGYLIIHTTGHNTERRLQLTLKDDQHEVISYSR